MHKATDVNETENESSIHNVTFQRQVLLMLFIIFCNGLHASRYITRLNKWPYCNHKSLLSDQSSSNSRRALILSNFMDTTNAYNHTAQNMKAHF